MESREREPSLIGHPASVDLKQHERRKRERERKKKRKKNGDGGWGWVGEQTRRKAEQTHTER